MKFLIVQKRPSNAHKCVVLRSLLEPGLPQRCGTFFLTVGTTLGALPLNVNTNFLRRARSNFRKRSTGDGDGALLNERRRFAFANGRTESTGAYKRLAQFGV